MRLWIRLTLAFAVIALVSVLSFAVFVVGELRNQAEAAALRSLEQEAELRADRLGDWVQDQARFLDGVGAALQRSARHDGTGAPDWLVERGLRSDAFGGGRGLGGCRRCGGGDSRVLPGGARARDRRRGEGRDAGQPSPDFCRDHGRGGHWGALPPCWRDRAVGTSCRVGHPNRSGPTRFGGPGLDGRSPAAGAGLHRAQQHSRPRGGADQWPGRRAVRRGPSPG